MSEDLRSIIVRRTSEMLDNPDEHDIYPTTNFYDGLENDLRAYIERRDKEKVVKATDADIIRHLESQIEGLSRKIEDLERQLDMTRNVLSLSREQSDVANDLIRKLQGDVQSLLRVVHILINAEK